MSALPDFEILQAYLAEVRQLLDYDLTPQGIGLSGQVELRHDLLYLADAIANGRWYVPGQNTQRWGAYNHFLETMRCRPLLGPWLNSTDWSAQDVADLKAIHAVTLELRPL